MKLADISIQRPVLATVLIATLAVFGGVALPRIGIDLFPEVEFPVSTITAVYPGADPETIETKVIDKLEQAVGTLGGVRMLRSTCMENVGFVVVQFELERKGDQAIQDVRDRVASVLRSLPKDIEPPMVQKLELGAAPILGITVSGSRPIGELTRIAERQVREQLQTLSGVGSVDLVGGQEREFHVFIDPGRMESVYLSIMDVVQALGAQNIEIPGGRLQVGQRELAVKTRGQVRSAAEIGDIIITAAAGAPVRVKDIARVEDGVQERRSSSELNGQSAISLIVRKQSGSNTVEVARKVRAALDQIRARLPGDVKLAVPVDNSIFIRNVVEDVQFDLIFGAILAVVVILFFLHDWRATLISALAIPASLIATVGFIKAMGFTFNTLTLLALSLSIGILVDDAIVVIENIHRHLEMGKPARKAAADATAEIGLAVMATTASIVAVFVPVATMQGIVGRFLVQFGLTVAFAVSVSLLVAFTLTPMLASRMLRTDKGNGNPLSRLIEAGLGWLDRTYRRILAAALGHRAWTIVIALAVLGGSVGLLRLVRLEFLPELDQGQASVKVELPSGSSLEATSAYVHRLAERLRRLPGVTDTLATVGGGAMGEVGNGEVQVNFVARRDRKFSQQEAVRYIRQLLRGEKEVVSVEEVSVVTMMGAGAMRQAVVQYNLRGSDFGELNAAARQIMAAMRKVGGYVDLDTTYRGGKPEVVIHIDRDRAADLGVPVAVVAVAVRLLVGGEKATDIQVGGERFDVRVRLDERFRSRPEDVMGLKVRSTNPGQMGMPPALVNLGSLVRVEESAGAGRIERENRRRQVTVLANLEGKTLGEAVSEIDELAKQLPAHIERRWTGLGDIMTESFGNLFAALLLSILMVYLILAAQFDSFVHPFTIMLSLPFSMIGAIGALLITRETLNILTMIGIIMLMGLVTKNAILLVDYANKLREKGMGRDEALLAAGPVRLRPILMTTAAMVFGMLPVALALGEGGTLRASMAIAVIGGLLTSTLLTLVVVPVAYSLIDALSEKVTGGRRGGEGAGAVAGGREGV